MTNETMFDSGEAIAPPVRAAATACLLALAACAVTPPDPPPPDMPSATSATQGLPPPLVRPPAAETYALVTANPDAARIIRGLGSRGLRPVPDDVSAVDQLASAPGYVWRVGPDWLHIHSYRSRPPAEAAAKAFVAQVMSRNTMIGWVGTPHLFQCGTTVVLY